MRLAYPLSMSLRDGTEPNDAAASMRGQCAVPSQGAQRWGASNERASVAVSTYVAESQDVSGGNDGRFADLFDDRLST